MSDESIETGRWRIACTMAILIAGLVYVGSWTGGLVWDDHYLIDGSAIGGGKSLVNCITTPFLNHYFRPLVSICFFFERRLWHDHPLGYRVVSTVLHMAVTGVLLGTLRDAFGSRRAAFLGALLFAIQPVQVGTAAWIGGRTDALCELWLALFAWHLIQAAQTVSRRGPHLAWSVIFFTLAVFTKEQILVLLPLVPLAFRCWKPRDSQNRPYSAVALAAFTAPFLIVAGLFLFLGYHLGMPRPSIFPSTVGDYMAQAGRIMGYYALVLLVPTPSLMHTLSLGALERAGLWPIALGYSALAACAIQLWRWRRSDPAAAWMLALVVLSLLPVSGFVPLPFLLVAPYRAAIAGIGLAALVGRWLDMRLPIASLSIPSKWKTSAASYLLAVMLIWHGGLTVWGALQWRDEVNMFRRMTSVDPDGIVTHYILAYMVGARSDYPEAARQLEATLQNLFGSEAWKRPETAARAIREDPRILERSRQNQGSTDDPHIWVATVYITLAQVYLNQGQTTSALSAYLAAEAVHPRDADTQAGIGFCEGLLGNVSEAVRRMRAALAIAPDLAYAHEWLSRYYTRAGNWDLAMPELQAWAKSAVASTEARMMLQDAETQIARRRALQSGSLFRSP